MDLQFIGPVLTNLSVVDCPRIDSVGKSPFVPQAGLDEFIRSIFPSQSHPDLLSVATTVVIRSVPALAHVPERLS